MMDEPSSSLATELLGLAIRAATDAAELVMTRYDAEHAIQFKLHGEVVTDVDMEAERLIRRRILSERAYDGILGEEDAPVSGETGITWFIDPVDGTANYVRKLPGFTVSIAASSNDTTLAAAICDPIHDALYSASRGGGAFVNGEPIRVSRANDIGNALIGTGFSIEPTVRSAQLRVLTQVARQVGDVRCSGACAYDLCQVAAGHLDGYYESHLKPWDYAAGLLIAGEAGADVREMRLKNRSKLLIVAATPGISAELQEFVGGAGPGGGDGSANR